ncbi:MAG TPA: RDD family protein, partial [Fimbriiglobus sp.]
ILLSFLLLLLTAVILALLGKDKLVEDASPTLLSVVVAVLYCLWLGYGIYFELRRNGRTPGKRIAGIRAIQFGGSPLDFRAAAVRNLLAVADFLPAFHILGAILILLTPNRQRLGDLAAGTIVVRERAVQLRPEIQSELGELATAEITFTPSQLTALTAADRNLLREFLQRYRGMERSSRIRLASKMRAKYIDKLDYSATANLLDEYTPVEFLASLLRDYEEFRRHD